MRGYRENVSYLGAASSMPTINSQPLMIAQRASLKVAGPINGAGEWRCHPRQKGGRGQR